ncbi:MAG: phage terminase large subunit [Coprobacillus sp.]
MDNPQDCSKLISAYHTAFKNSNFNNIKNLYTVANNLYDSMYQHYDYCTYENKIKQQYRICQIIDEDILQKLDNAVYLSKDMKTANKLVELRKLYFALSARRILKNFALYVEQYKNKKVWDKTMDTMESVFHYADIFSVSNKLNLFRASMMPSMGKSYTGNLFVAQSIGNNPNVQILRITYSDDLCVSSTRQTAGIIDSQAFREIFPRYKKYPGDKIFKSQTSYQICIADCEDEYNLNAVTREGQSTGKRANILIIDDLLKDDTESYNKDLHKKLLNRYESTWSSRADDESLKIMLLGTMWSDTDLLNVLYDREAEDDDLIPDPKYKWVEVSKEGKSVWIGIPALDEKNKSTCPKRYSSEFLKKKMKNMDKFLWMCVYQQNPIAPEGLDFDWSALPQYDSIPTDEIECRYASLDPARKGKNYVAMPIFYKYHFDEKYYLVDFLYKKKSMKELYDDIVDKIIMHKLNKLVVENNTDTSLKEVLETKLKEKGYFGCIITEKYSTQNKEKRINDNQGDIRNMIVYPRKGMHPPNSDMGKAMEGVTSFSFSYPNKFDDGIDSVCLFVMEFISIVNHFAIARGFDRRKLGI